MNKKETIDKDAIELQESKKSKKIEGGSICTFGLYKSMAASA